MSKWFDASINKLAKVCETYVKRGFGLTDQPASPSKKRETSRDIELAGQQKLDPHKS